MSRQSNQFDERDALQAAGALRVRAPTLQKKRIRKSYARQFRREAEETEEQQEHASVTAKERAYLNGSTEGKTERRKQAGKRPAFSEGRSKGEDPGTDSVKVFRKRSSRGLTENVSPDTALKTAYGYASGGKDHFFSNEIDARRTLPDEGIVRQKGRKKPAPNGRNSSDSAFHEGRKASGSHGTAHFSEDRTAGSVAAVRSGLFHESAFSAEYQVMSAKDLQKKQIRRAYTGQDVVYIPVVSEIRERRANLWVFAGVKKAAEKISAGVAKHPLIVAGIVMAALFMGILSTIAAGSMTVIGQVVTPAITETSITADDADIEGAERDYILLEAELRAKLSDLERYYPGYENYELQSSEISHDPYRLAALLTVLHERYTREDVQQTLKRIFAAQYALTTEDITGTSTTKTVRVGQSLGVVVTSGYCNCSICCGVWAGGPTASGVYPQANHTIAVDAWNPIVPMGTKIVMNGTEYTVEDTGPLERYGVAFDVYYDDHNVAENHGHQNWEAFIADDNGSETVTVTVVNSQPTLKATLRNYGLDHAAYELLDDDQYARYQLLVEMKGNRPELFPDYNELSANAGLTYAPPGSVLSDEKFRNMYNEAIKYLGIKYVWGGESPDTGFDCSGFVSWVINHCGNGWNYGRLLAEEWRQVTMYVPPSDAQPGDLIFFQGTYDTDGASHIGIYLGDGMMIHAGHPVQIGSINTPYFQEHFLSFGRILS